MCIICVKPKNKAIPTVEYLTACFKNNPDGAGFMYPQNGKIRVLKGFMTLESLLNALNEIPDSKKIPIVIHFRYGTHGSKSAANTHPFPISGSFNDLKLLDTEVERAIVHNGIMYQYGSKNASLSDSAFFAKLLSGLRTDRAIKRAIEAHKNYGKFAVMSADEKNGANLLRIGDFVKFNGCFWSNYGFRPAISQTEPVKVTISNDSIEDMDSIFYSKYPQYAPKYANLACLDSETEKDRQIELKFVGGQNKHEIERERKFRAFLQEERTRAGEP
jgi:hypothetical protein